MIKNIIGIRIFFHIYGKKILSLKTIYAIQVK